MRIGHGYDVHRFAENRPLVLGGVTIPFGMGLDGHSDADVLTHAVMDALLGAAGLRDIGYHFPDTDPEYKGICSMVLLGYVAEKIHEKGYELENLDATLVAQAPKLKDLIPQMMENISSQLSVDVDKINIKATTEEKMGFTGRMEGMACHAVCLLKEME